MHLMSSPARPHVNFFVVSSVSVEHLGGPVAPSDHVEGHDAVGVVEPPGQSEVGQFELPLVVEQDVSAW